MVSIIKAEHRPLTVVLSESQRVSQGCILFKFFLLSNENNLLNVFSVILDFIQLNHSLNTIITFYKYFLMCFIHVHD